MHLLEKPWLIIARTSPSRGVRTQLLDCAERSPASPASQRASRLPGKGRISRCFDPGVFVPGTKVAKFETALIDLLLSVEAGPAARRPTSSRAPALVQLSSCSLADLA